MERLKAGVCEMKYKLKRAKNKYEKI